MHKVWRIAIGVLFLIVGVLGLILPILPGTVFILLGLLAFSTVFEPVGHLFEWLREKHPKLHNILAHWREKLFPDHEAT
jgi:uncharacterized membrane protein YbaN (DUF454 family)